MSTTSMSTTSGGTVRSRSCPFPGQDCTGRPTDAACRAFGVDSHDADSHAVNGRELGT